MDKLNRPGAALSRAREAKGLSIAEVAASLRLSVSQVEALETDAYEKLPGPTFVRGFIRNYSKLVQIDPAPLLEATHTNHRKSPEASPESVMRAVPFRGKNERAWRRYALIGLFIGLIVPVVLFEAKQETFTLTKSKKPVQVVENVQPVLSNPVTVVEPLTESSESKIIAAAPKKSVRLMFNQDSWAEVKDNTGNVLYSQLGLAGSEQLIEGEPPFSLVVGNASYVKIAYNDQLVDLAPYTKAEVARLTLQ